MRFLSALSCAVVLTLEIINIWVGYPPSFSFSPCTWHWRKHRKPGLSFTLRVSTCTHHPRERTNPQISDLDLSENSLISLEKSRKLPTSLGDEDNTLFLSLFLGLTGNFSRQSCPGCVCAENVSQWIGSSALGISALLQCRLIYFFPFFHFFEEDTIYLCLSSAWGMK